MPALPLWTEEPARLFAQPLQVDPAGCLVPTGARPSFFFVYGVRLLSPANLLVGQDVRFACSRVDAAQFWRGGYLDARIVHGNEILSGIFRVAMVELEGARGWVTLATVGQSPVISPAGPPLGDPTAVEIEAGWFPPVDRYAVEVESS